MFVIFEVLGSVLSLMLYLATLFAIIGYVISKIENHNKEV